MQKTQHSNIHTIQYPIKKLRYVKQVEKCDPQSGKKLEQWKQTQK